MYTFELMYELNAFLMLEAEGNRNYYAPVMIQSDNGSSSLLLNSSKEDNSFFFFVTLFFSFLLPLQFRMLAVEKNTQFQNSLS